MAKDYEDQEQTLREEIARYEKELESTKNYQLLSKRRNDLLDKINTANRKIQEQRLPEAGSIKRVGMALDPLSGIYHGIHQANEATKQDASIKTFVKSFGKAYSQAIANQGKTLWTGKDYTLNQKFASDILTKQMGLPNNAATKTLGLAMDISTSPAIYGAYKPAFTLMNYMGKSSAKLASKSATIQKGIDAFGTRFDIFYQAGKTMSAEKIKELKDAYQIAVESRDFTKLIAFRDQFATVAQKVAHPRLAEGKRAFDQMGAVVSGTKTKYVDMLEGQYYAKKSSLASLFKEQTGRDISEKWLSGSGLSMENAAKPLASLSADAKKRVIASLEQWTHIISPQSQHYKSFARSVLPELKTGGKLDPNKYDNLIGPAKQAWEAAVKKKETIGAWLKQAENYEAPAKILSATPQAREVTKLMNRINAPKIYNGISGTFGKGVDTLTNLYKAVLSFNPIFNTRNAIGTTWQGLSQIKGNSIGAGLKSYVDAYKMVTGKGKYNPEMYGELAQRGYFKQYGMATNDFGEALHKWNLPAKLANFSESINRTAHTLYMKSGGKSLTEAADATSKVFYKYGTAYKTAFEENIMSRMFPFYDFMKGQVKFWPGELANNGGFWSSAYKVKEATLPDHLKEFPYLRQQWEKGMYTVGNTGGLSFQAEDFQKNITLDTKNLFSMLNPLIKLAAEGTAGYDVFREKPIKDYGQWLANYNPMQQPISNAISASEGKKSWLSVFTSIRDYDLSAKSLTAQNQMNAKNQSSYWVSLIDKFRGVTPQAQTATQTGGGTAAPYGSVDLWNAKMVADFEKKYGTGTFGKKRAIYGGPDQDFYHNESQKAGERLTKLMQTASNDIGDNFDKQAKQTIRNYLGDAFYAGHSPELQQQTVDLMNQQTETLRPHLVGKKPLFSPGVMKYRPAIGKDEVSIGYNQAYNEMTQFTSKTSDIWASVQEKGPQQIMRALQADIDGVKKQMASGWGSISQEQANSRIAAYEAKAELDMKKWDEKRREKLAKDAKAELDYITTVTKGHAENLIAVLDGIYKRGGMSIEKYYDEKFKAKKGELLPQISSSLNLIRSIIGPSQTNTDGTVTSKVTGIQAPQEPKKYRKERLSETLTGTVSQIWDGDTAVVAMPGGKKEVIRMAYIDAPEVFHKGKNGEPDKPAQPFGEEAKAKLTEFMPLNSQIQMNLKNIDKNGRLVAEVIRNGLNVNQEMIKSGFAEMYSLFMPDKEKFNLYKDLQVGSQTAKAGMWSQDTAYQSPEQFRKTGLPSGNYLNDLDSLDKIIQDPKTSPSVLINKVQDVLKKLALDFSKVDKPEFLSAIKTLQKQLSDYGLVETDSIYGPREANDKVQKALIELRHQSEQNKFEVYRRSAERMGYFETDETMPKGGKQDLAETEYQANINSINNDTYSKLQGAVGDFPADDFNLTPKKTDQSMTDYFTQTEKELADHISKKETLTAAGQARLEAMDIIFHNGKRTRDDVTAAYLETNLQKSLQVATNSASNLAAAAETIWQASNGKCKEAFYVMKSLAIAEATIKGYQAAVEAYAQGMKISPAMAAMYAGASMAFTGAQVGAMMSDIVNGPPERKAKGGEITRGSGTKDDVPIMAMRGEYVIRKSAVNRYGRGFMDALNKELLPTSNFAFPDIPASAGNRGFYAEGGEIGRGVITPVTVNLKNESGHELEQTQSSVDFNGDEYIINVVIDAVQRNKGGMRDIMGGQG